MTRLRRPLLVAAVVALVAAAAAFALGPPRADRSAAPAGLPPCASSHARVARPAGLRAFPLPTGARLETTTTEYGYTVVSGVVPGAINPVRDLLLARLPAIGYRLGAGDSETGEAEAAFTGHGVRGRYVLRTLFSCPGALSLRIAVRSARG